jgi:hypothetical protein
MRRNTSMAGGCFLTAAILIGTIWGVMAQAPMKGVLIGTGTGIALAVLVWLVDAARQARRD